jgi:SAM-dependent methyltransferase
MRRIPQPVMVASAATLAVCLAMAAAHADGADVEVPYVVSPPAVTRTMLEIAKVTPTDYVLDLGSGDGRIVVLAARQYGARGLGVEIDPRLVQESRRNADKAGVAARAEFREEDLFKTDLSRATVITMYLLPDVNLALREKLLALRPGTRIVSHDWDMGDWLHDELRVVDHPEKTVGIEKTSKVFRWTVPARIGGRWCAETEHGPLTLNVTQRYQKVDGSLEIATPRGARKVVSFRATLDGTRFAIPHPGLDARAVADDNLIRIDLAPYGFRKEERFSRGDCRQSVAQAGFN